MSENTELEIIRVSTIGELLERASNQSRTIRAGSTENPEIRAADYRRRGFRGVMLIAKTQNMKRAENQLLEIKDWLHNVHEKSNHNESPGYVYVIIGQRFKNPEIKVGANVRGLPLEDVNSQAELYEIGRNYGVIKSGTTSNPEQRATSLWDEGYRTGTMFVAKTGNMKMAGDKLLKNLPLGQNLKQATSASETSGYLYVVAPVRRE